MKGRLFRFLSTQIKDLAKGLPVCQTLLLLDATYAQSRADRVTEEVFEEKDKPVSAEVLRHSNSRLSSVHVQNQMADNGDVI